MEIKNLRRIDKGCLKCAFTLVIPEWGQIEIDGLYFENNKGSQWVNFAPKEYTDKEGQKKTYNQVRWPKEVYDKLMRAIKEKIVFQALEPTHHNFEKEEKIPF